jgi:hypothetical protein
MLGVVLIAGVARAEPPDPNLIPDPWFPGQWALLNSGQAYPDGCTSGCGQGTPGADLNWLKGYSAGSDGQGVIIAIGTPGLLPTVRCPNSQIAPQLWVNPGESGGGKESNGVDDDGNGYVDDVNGANFLLNNGLVCASGSVSNHDTDVSRLMVAPVDGAAGVGVAPGAKLMILSGWSNVTFFTKVLPYAETMGARVIVVPYTAMALGAGATPEDQCASAGFQGGINRPGLLAGSDVLVFWGFSDEFPSCDAPAAAVGFSDSDDAAQNAPDPFVDFVAPGERGWATGVAQSWALAHAAGVAALAVANEPAISRAALLQRLRDGAEEVGPLPYDASGRNDQYGFGRLNAWLSLKLGDLDGDGVPGDGNGSGVAGDAPCATGQTSGCDDNCPYAANPTQDDTGGLSTLPPDGIGDVCQCGDLTGNGMVDTADLAKLRWSLGNAYDPGELCDVGSGCTTGDVSRMTFALGSLDPSVLLQACTPANP